MDPFRLFGNRQVMSPRRKQPFFRQSNQVTGVMNIGDFIPTGYPSLPGSRVRFQRYPNRNPNSQDRSEARSGDQKDKSNALGLEYGLVRYVGVPIVQDEHQLFNMKIKFIHYVNKSPARGIDATTTPKRMMTVEVTKHNIRIENRFFSHRNLDTLVSIKLWAVFASSGMSAQTMKIGHFVLPFERDTLVQDSPICALPLLKHLG
ncbi:hypothetical protein EVAR_13214_1 [Eumeta japonica]|uniref:Uncharacterized protein n=1 Tax=Eumeta variegata TaxID=151549 RepID=A0A4C1TS52_EUMVA|nr:hypothetical protein EVAR_13214_1 [Eumeta japonica]